METLQMFYIDNYLNLLKFYPKDDFYFRSTYVLMDGDIYVDRFSLLHEHSKYRWGNFESAVLPKYTDVGYIDICVEHAKKYIQKYDKIAVMWSGGVDSTGLIAILLEAGMNPKNIDVIGTVTSLKEAPNFDKYFKKLGVNFIEVPAESYMYSSIDEVTDAPVILTGICNDQLWYKGIIIKAYKNQEYLEVIKRKWQDQILTVYRHSNLMQYAMNDIEIYNEYFKSLDMECDSYAEFTHMHNFCFHWEYVKQFYWLQTGSIVNKRMYNFYDTQELQDWSYTNRKYCAETAFLCSQGKLEFYKEPLKKLIYKYFKDEDYYNYKIKDDSLKNYKAEIQIPYYPLTIKTNKRTIRHFLKPSVTNKQYASYAFGLLEEFKK